MRALTKRGGEGDHRDVENTLFIFPPHLLQRTTILEASPAVPAAEIVVGRQGLLLAIIVVGRDDRDAGRQDLPPIKRWVVTTGMQ